MVDEEKTKEQLIDDLRKCENRFHALFNLPLIGMAIVSPDMQWIEANDRLCEMIGYSREELLKITWADVTPKEDLEQELNEYYRRIYSGEIAGYILEKRFVRKNGVIIDTAISVNSVKKDDNSIDYLVVLIKDIKESKRAKEALRKSEEKYRNIFDNAIEGIFQTTPEGKYVSVNRSFARMFGFSSAKEMIENIVDIGYQIYVNPEDRERLKHLLTKYGVVERLEAQVYRNDKSKFWISINAHAVRDSAGSILYYEGTKEDITKRKLAEELLKESENKFHLLFEKSLDPVVLLHGYKYVDCNEAAVRIMGCSSKEELIGLHPGQTSPEVQPDGEKSFVKARDIIARTMREGSSRFEWVHKKINGEEFWSDVSLTAITIGGKDLIYDVWKDITDRKNIEAALKRSEIRYRRMFDHNPLPAFVFDLNTLEIIDVNEAAIIHYGYSYEEFTNMKITELHPSGDFSSVLSQLKKPKLGKTKGPWKHVKKDGTLIDAEISGHTLEFSGKLCRIAIVNDITDRKKAEEELKRSYEQLRILSTHINKAREKERKDVARELHDELGQILTTLNMDISLIKKQLSSTTANTLLFEEADAMSVLIKQAIKSVQKVSAELRPVILDDFGLVPALEWAVNKFKIQTDIDTKITIGGGIDLDGERSTQIYRIVQESLTNVARHASATKLNIRLEREGDDIVLEIKDNGKGISDKEKTDMNSFGILGMKERAVILGGEFTINGIRGKGTTVKVKVPFSSHSEQEGEAGVPALAGRGLMPGEGATPSRGQAQVSTQGVKGLSSSHSEREGEAPTALPVEGATQAPEMEEQ
ncbi:MAG: PAS domain S-box protein [Proteobacteria bacterium]|nr:PAS domain S-box protein [Pseudomonadota bacterium]